MAVVAIQRTLFRAGASKRPARATLCDPTLALVINQGAIRTMEIFARGPDWSEFWSRPYLSGLAVPAAVETMGPALVNEAAEADARASHRAPRELAALPLEVGAVVVAESPSEWNLLAL